MSAVLVVTKNKKQVARVNLTGPKFIIGRGNQCDYPVDEELASRKHVEISIEGTDFWLQDLKSTNGTLLNGKKISARTQLKDGDEIGIGSTRLRFLCDTVRAGAEGEDDLTRPANPAMPSDVPPKLSAKAKEDKPSGPLFVKLRISGGPLDGGVFKNWDGPLTIGRGLENTVVLLDNAVSTRHARIVQEGEAYFIEDLDSANGTFLNGVKVRRERLAHGQKVKVGASTLLFELVDIRKRRRLIKIVGLSTVALVAVVAAIKLLQPPDVAGQHIERGRQFAVQGQLEKAQEAYQAALKLEPNRSEARKEFNKVKGQLDAKHILDGGEKAAEEERYDKAKEAVYRVLRDYPKHPRALELEAAVKSIENATVAYKARNWADAVTLLEKAREKYPKSQLVATRLEAAQKELMAERSLARARDAAQHRQDEVAEGLLKIIPSGSAYYPEARELLDRIGTDRKTSDRLQKAQADYRAARLTQALAEVEEGLKVAPTNTVLLDLRTRARKLDALQGALVQAEAMKETDPVDSLLAGRTTCENVLSTEPDSLNEMRRRAQDTKNNIDQWLRTQSQAFTTQAQGLKDPAQVKEALRLFTLAVRADPGNQTATAAARKIRDEIIRECKKLYGEGLRFEELEQKSLAQERFRKVVELAPPDEEYYKKASAKLK